MSRPLTVTIPHSLGREVALKRIKDGLEQLRGSYAGQFTVIEENWTGSRLDFKITALKQTISGSIDVSEAEVVIAVMLPLLFSILAEKARMQIQHQAQGMLEKK